jgi:hypothetical protein
MKVGSIYKYQSIIKLHFDYVFVYDIEIIHKSTYVSSYAKCINIQDCSDFRNIANTYWNSWIEVE